MPTPDTKKYEPLQRRRSLSPNQPPASVAVMPANTVIAPNRVVTRSKLGRHVKRQVLVPKSVDIPRHPECDGTQGERHGGHRQRVQHVRRCASQGCISRPASVHEGPAGPRLSLGPSRGLRMPKADQPEGQPGRQRNVKRIAPIPALGNATAEQVAQCTADGYGQIEKRHHATRR